jgi:hypothetical protein
MMIEKQENDDPFDRLDSSIKALIPSSLDDVIRRQRQHFQLRITTEEEIFDLYKTIWPVEPKDGIDNWNLISLHHPVGHKVFLLGVVRSKGCPRITSEVTGIDLHKGFLTTHSGSLYQLGSKKNGPPTLVELLLVCSTFHKWGFGAELGVPHFIL